MFSQILEISNILIFMILIGSAVSDVVSEIDSAMEQLDAIADQDAIMKLTFVKFFLASDLFGGRRKRSEHSKIQYFHNQLV